MPATSVIVVIRIGRSRSRLACRIACIRGMPSCRNELVWSICRIEFFFTTPNSTRIPSALYRFKVSRKNHSDTNPNGTASGSDYINIDQFFDGVIDTFQYMVSKSTGNGVDPIDVIDKFGPDSLRFGLTWLATETQDVRMPVQFECPHCEAQINQTKQNRELYLVGEAYSREGLPMNFNLEFYQKLNQKLMKITCA